MQEDEKHILEQFEARLRDLLGKHKELKEENRKLAAQVTEKENQLIELQQSFTDLEQLYTNLKQARMISLSYDEVDKAKEHIGRLVREIDQCIDSLIKQQ